MSTGFMIFLKNICFYLLCFFVFWFFKIICFRKKQSKKQDKPATRTELHEPDRVEVEVFELQADNGQKNKSSSSIKQEDFNKVKKFSLRGGTTTTTTGQ
ncbi:unnamed protein product [Brassica napus]|nr:unnamed protein product [Brassica napus]